MSRVRGGGGPEEFFVKKIFARYRPVFSIFFHIFFSGQGGGWSTRKIFLKKFFSIVIYRCFIFFSKNLSGQGYDRPE